MLTGGIEFESKASTANAPITRLFSAWISQFAGFVFNNILFVSRPICKQNSLSSNTCKLTEGVRNTKEGFLAATADKLNSKLFRQT